MKKGIGKNIELEVFCDGGSRGNPGPAAAGVVIKRLDPAGQIERLESFGRYLGDRFTNNQAEYLALLESLKALQEYKPKRAVFFLDSELLVRQLTGHYRVKNKQLQRYYRQARALLEAVPAYEFKLIPREENREADALVNRALDKNT